jgi:transketolase
VTVVAADHGAQALKRTPSSRARVRDPRRDLYSVKPVDAQTLREAAHATRAVVTVEDHVAEGGLGEAVRSALAGAPTPVFSLAVRSMPKSGKPAELLDYEGISAAAIVRRVKELL